LTPRGRRPVSHLSAREQEVVDLLGAGHVQKEIADRLELSIWTVKGYLASARKRTGTRTNAQLATRFSRRPSEHAVSTDR
jgi:DNA-binding CsgD family transcriptional regulator